MKARHPLALLLVAALLAVVPGGPGPAAGPAAAYAGPSGGANVVWPAPAALAAPEVPDPATRARRVPVVLVHGIRPARETWGEPGGDGLLGRLARAGYQPGQTLFWSEAGPWRDPVTAAHEELAPLLRRAAAAAGTPAVDVVAHTSGALLVQQLLHAGGAAPGGADPRGGSPGAQPLPAIRHLILIAPFSAGHEGAAAVRAAALRSALLERHRREGLPRNTGPAQPYAGLEPGPAFDEAGYVVSRAYDFYEPAYHHFVREAWFLRPPDDPHPSPEFWHWLEDRDPDLAAVLLSRDPPVPGGPPLWKAGTDLTRAYYEQAALDAARAVYHSLRPVGEVLLEDWESDLGDLSGGWRAALARFLAGRAAHLLRTYGPPWLAHGRDAALEALFSSAAGASPLAAPVRRLEPLDHNLWLEAVRLPGGWGARSQGPRVVAIGGRLAGPLVLLLPQPELLEAGADLPWPADVDDLVHVVDGWWGVDPASLPRHRAVIDRVVDELERWEQVVTVAAPGPGPVRRVVQAAAGEPRYLRPTGGGGAPDGGAAGGSATAGSAGGWTVSLQPRSGLLAAWALDPVTGRRLAGPARSRTPGEVVTLAVPAGAVVGWRLLPADAAGTPPGPDAAVPVEVTLVPAASPPVEPGPAPGAPGTPAGAAPAAPPDDGPGRAPGTPAGTAGGTAPSAAPGGVPAVPGGPAPGPAPGAAPGGGDSGGGDVGDLPEGLPLIRVVLHTRLTTDKQERREHHGRWVWDFGDGHGFVDDDPEHVVSEVAHRFRGPGTYTVTARAESNQGRTIRTLTWPVEVPAGQEGVLHVFRAESIREPQVTLELQGPVEWVNGRPAVFALEARIEAPPFGEVVEVRHYPGERFAVLWERPGHDFLVRAAVWVKVRYTFPEGGTFTVQNIYVIERTVDVLALGSDGR